jgi:hypothetical protein
LRDRGSPRSFPLSVKAHPDQVEGDHDDEDEDAGERLDRQEKGGAEDGRADEAVREQVLPILEIRPYRFENTHRSF